MSSITSSTTEVMRFFGYAHLPAHLQEVSKRFSELATMIATELPDCREREKALDRLLEAKDAAVRAKLLETSPRNTPGRDD